MTNYPLAELAALAAQRNEADAAIPQAVADARAEGASWQAIGTALGMTRQAAHEKYANRI